MDTVQVMRYGGAPIRTVNHDGELWFCVSDVCERLDIDNAARVAREQLADDERQTFHVGRQGETWFCNEPGLYRIIFRSNKPEAEKFKRWVFHDVLPSIRRNGVYVSLTDSVNKAMKEEKVSLCLLALNIAPRMSSYIQKAKRAEHLYNELDADELCRLFRIPKKERMIFMYRLKSYKANRIATDEARIKLLNKQKLVKGGRND